MILSVSQRLCFNFNAKVAEIYILWGELLFFEG